MNNRCKIRGGNRNLLLKVETTERVIANLQNLMLQRFESCEGIM